MTSEGEVTMIDAFDKVNGSTQPEYPLAVPHTTAGTNDGVVLSETAQAKLLEQGGLSVTEIADQLGIATSTVLAELAIIVTNS